MRGLDLLEKLSLADEQYVTAAGAARPRRRRGALYAVAACLCLFVCAGALFAALRFGAPRVVDEDGFYIENGVLLRYSGSKTDVVLPTAVKSVADYAFMDNKNAAAISSVTIGSSVERVGTNAFAGLENLTRLILEDESTAFVERDGGIFTFDGSMLVRFEDAEATEYRLPDGVVYIAAHAFQSSKLEKITFCDTLEYIGFNAFADCRALRAIELPGSIARVEDGAFSSCVSAVDGFVPEHVELGQNAFYGVPFFLTQIAGHISPLEQIVRGQITPSEAIVLSDREGLLMQVDAILDYYRTGEAPSGETARLTNIVGADLPAGAVLPDKADFDALSFRDNGWGGTGIRDIQILLPLGGEVTLVMEAYLYGGALELLDWDNAEWRIEQLLFLAETAETDTYGVWRVTETDGTLVFHNTETDAAVRTSQSIDKDTEYELTFSPKDNRVIVEYNAGGDWYFFVQSLDGETFTVSMNSYVDYINRYFGKYVRGSLSWKDNDTIAGENEYGEMEYNLYELYPKQITDIRSAYRENVLVDRLLRSETDLDSITEYYMTVPESWTGENYLEDAARIAAHPGEATRMTGYYALHDPDGLYEKGEWNITALSNRGMTTYGAETIVSDAEKLVLHGKFAESKASFFSSAVCIGNKVVISCFTVYPEDPDDYYTRVILPVIESFRTESAPNYFGFDMRAEKNGEEQLITFESLRYADGKTLLTLTGETGNTLVLDAAAAFPYDAAREGERLLYSDIGGGYFWIDAGAHLRFGGGTEEAPLADGETIDLGDVSALWD